MRQRRLVPWLVPCASPRGASNPGAERREPKRALDLGRHRPGAVALVVGDIFQRGAAQAPAGREIRDRLQAIGLSGAVEATSAIMSPRAAIPARAIIAEMRQRQAMDAGWGHGGRDVDRSDPLPLWAHKAGEGNERCQVTPAWASGRRALSYSRDPQPASGAGVGELESDLAFDLAGDVEQVARVEADIERVGGYSASSSSVAVPESGLITESVSLPGGNASFTARPRSAEIVETRSTAAAKSPCPRSVICRCYAESRGDNRGRCRRSASRSAPRCR